MNFPVATSHRPSTHSRPRTQKRDSFRKPSRPPRALCNWLRHRPIRLWPAESSFALKGIKRIRLTTKNPSRMNSPAPQPRPLSLLSVVLPVRDEAGCIGSTVEHLHLELRLQKIPHEIIVVDDGSTDGTWDLLARLEWQVPGLVRVKNPGPHGFGRAVVCGFDRMKGDAVIVMMGDESDDCRDAVRYWQELNLGWDCVFGSRFIK